MRKYVRPTPDVDPQECIPLAEYMYGRGIRVNKKYDHECLADQLSVYRLLCADYIYDIAFFSNTSDRKSVV